MLDKLKDLGFKYSTLAGITVSMSDVATSSKNNNLSMKVKLLLIKLTNNINVV